MSILVLWLPPAASTLPTCPSSVKGVLYTRFYPNGRPTRQDLYGESSQDQDYRYHYGYPPFPLIFIFFRIFLLSPARLLSQLICGRLGFGNLLLDGLVSVGTGVSGLLCLGFSSVLCLGVGFLLLGLVSLLLLGLLSFLLLGLLGFGLVPKFDEEVGNDVGLLFEICTGEGRFLSDGLALLLEHLLFKPLFHSIVLLEQVISILLCDPGHHLANPAHRVLLLLKLVNFGG